MSRLAAPSPRRRRGPGSAAVRIGVIAACGLLIGGCSAPSPEASGPAASSTSSDPASDPTEAPEEPLDTIDPAGTADDNLSLFAHVVSAVWVTDARDQGRAYVDALVAAGFDRSAMEVTADTSTTGAPAESIQFAVRWQDDCLVGQVGPTIDVPVAVVVPGLVEGGCLVGETRPIDW